MKKKLLKKLGIVFVFATFSIMALGSGSSDSEKNSKEITANKDSQETTKPDVSISEQILLDQDGLKITATGIEDDSILGKGIKLLIENNSDKNLGVGCNALIVNDYMITDLFSTTVAAGKKANEIMYMSSSSLEAAGISNIGQIEIFFHIFNSDNYQTLYDPDGVTIQTSLYDSMDIDSSTASEGQELYNQNGIRIVGKYVNEDSFWGAAVLLYIENTSGQNIGVNCDNMSINGFMVTPLYSSTVYNNKRIVDDITILSSDLEKNGITSVDEIEVNFHIYNADNYNTITDTGAIKFATK